MVSSINSFLKIFFKGFFRLFFRLFFTPQCPICHEPQATDNICAKCFNSVSFLTNACRKCQEPFEYHIPGVDVCQTCAQRCGDQDLSFYDSMICAMKYNEVVKNLVVRFKNQNDFSLANLFARWIMSSAKFSTMFENDYVLVPVPLYKKRLVMRGYNQSLLLAKKLAALTNLPYMNLLKRVRDTNSQATKTISQRADNVKGAFALDPKFAWFVCGKKFIIIDDVITTGATLFECAKVLHKAGAKEIQLVAIARRLKLRAKEKVDLSGELYS